MVQGIKLVLKEKTILDVYFSDKSVKRYDMLSLADKYPMFNELKNRKLFLKGKLLGWGSVYFNDDIDIDTETIYYDGIDVSYEYDDISLVVLGFKIKDKRLEREMTQQELANIIKIDQADLSKIEKGKFNISINTLERICKGLACDLNIDLK